MRRHLARRLSPAVLAGVRNRTRDGSVALTFDDGPHAAFTPAIAAALAEIGVRATFFVVGRDALRHPQLVRELVEAGHALGSHSMTHPRAGSVSLRRLVIDYRDGRRVVEDACGSPVRLFRPPYGEVTAKVAAAVRVVGLEPWLWSHDTHDWRPDRRASEIAAVGSELDEGAVVLLHDGVQEPVDPLGRDRSATAASVRSIVEQGTAKGLRFGPLASGCR